MRSVLTTFDPIVRVASRDGVESKSATEVDPVGNSSPTFPNSDILTRIGLGSSRSNRIGSGPSIVANASEKNDVETKAFRASGPWNCTTHSP